MAIHNILGDAAEDAVKKFLQKNKYKILDTNWKTKWCEIDIVAKKDRVIYFVEVKYRSSSSQGSGFDYINNKKINQMGRAADSWVTMNKWDGEYVLSAAEVSGETFKIEFISEI